MRAAWWRRVKKKIFSLSKRVCFPPCSAAVVCCGGWWWARGHYLCIFHVRWVCEACVISGICVHCLFCVRMGGWEPVMEMSLFWGVSVATRLCGLGWRVCALVVQRERLECVWQMRMYITNPFLLRFPLVYAPEYGVFCCQWQVFENSVFCGELQACACCSMWTA